MNSTSERLTDSLPDLHRYAGLGRKRMSTALNRVALGMRTAPRVQDPDHALTQLSDSSQILVLCHGNICRSPLAERLFRTRLRDRGIDDVSIESAGFVERDGRASPAAAVEAAEGFGVDLTGHASTHATEDLLQASDLILLMDAYNYTLLRRYHRERVQKACFLKSFTDGDDYEISDPYDASIEEFERVYQEIADAICAFVDRLEARER